MRLYKAETASITAAEGGSYTSNALSVTVSPLGISALSLAAATTTPGCRRADNLTITAKDTYGNTATSYNATLNLTFSGATAIGAFTPTVTNSSGTAINFGTATALTFTNGVASVTGSSNGVMTLYYGPDGEHQRDRRRLHDQHRHRYRRPGTRSPPSRSRTREPRRQARPSASRSAPSTLTATPPTSVGRAASPSPARRRVRTMWLRSTRPRDRAPPARARSPSRTAAPAPASRSTTRSRRHSP